MSDRFTIWILCRRSVSWPDSTKPSLVCGSACVTDHRAWPRSSVVSSSKVSGRFAAGRSTTAIVRDVDSSMKVTVIVWCGMASPFRMESMVADRGRGSNRVNRSAQPCVRPETPVSRYPADAGLRSSVTETRHGNHPHHLRGPAAAAVRHVQPGTHAARVLGMDGPALRRGTPPGLDGG